MTEKINKVKIYRSIWGLFLIETFHISKIFGNFCKDLWETVETVEIVLSILRGS